MSTTSQHLGLKLNDGSDPFLRTDFLQNYNTLDQYPGTWICTSTTRPAWGSQQAGMCIIETDTRRTLLWNGTTFREMLYGPAVWWGSLRPNATLTHGTTASYTVGTFTVTRPGTLVTFSTVEYLMPNRGYATATSRPLIDGAASGIDYSMPEYVETNFPNNSTFGTGGWTDTMPVLGVRNIAAGSHSIGLQTSTSDSGLSLTLMTIRTLAMFANATDR